MYAAARDGCGTVRPQNLFALCQLDGFLFGKKDPFVTPAPRLAAVAWLAPSRTDGGDAARFEGTIPYI